MELLLGWITQTEARSRPMRLNNSFLILIETTAPVAPGTPKNSIVIRITRESN